MISPGSLLSPFKFLYQLWSDQTHIVAVPATAQGFAGNVYPLSLKETGDARLMFGITTTSRAEVEVQALEVHFRPPLQLIDPGNRGFFATNLANRTDYPFMVHWAGSAVVYSGLTQVLAVDVKSAERSERYDLVLHVRARSLRKSLDGFSAPGRSKLSIFPISIGIAEAGYMGVQIPPKAAITLLQPFLIEAPVQVAVEPGNVGEVQLHMVNKDGTTASSRHEIKG